MLLYQSVIAIVAPNEGETAAGEEAAMADEVRASAPGPNGNGFLLDLSQKKLGLTGPNVALLLLIIIIGGVAWLRTGTINKTLQASQEQLAGTEERVQKRVDHLFARMDKLIDDIHAHTVKITDGQHGLRLHGDEIATKQADLFHQHTNAIDSKLVTLTAYIDKWFTEIGTSLELLNYNLQHPNKALPLRAPLPPEGAGSPRGR